MERAGVGMIGKQHFTYLYSPARKIAFSKRNILAGWCKAGLFPFNPERVLRDLPKPQDLSTGAVDGPERHGTAQETAPRTPLTPISIEALTSLQNIIVQDACTLDETSRRNLERHLQKLAKAAGTFCAKNALQQDQVSFLLKANNEAKVRRATKSIVLGKAKVMSYNDLVAARAARIEKEATRKCGRKNDRRAKKTDSVGHDAIDCAIRNSKPGEADMVVEASSDKAQLDEEGVPRVPFRAPVACMY